MRVCVCLVCVRTCVGKVYGVFCLAESDIFTMSERVWLCKTTGGPYLVLGSYYPTSWVGIVVYGFVLNCQSVPTDQLSAHLGTYVCIY